MRQNPITLEETSQRAPRAVPELLGTARPDSWLSVFLLWTLLGLLRPPACSHLLARPARRGRVHVRKCVMLCEMSGTLVSLD